MQGLSSSPDIFKRAAKTTALVSWAQEEGMEKDLEAMVHQAAVKFIEWSQMKEQLLKKMEKLPRGSKDRISAEARLRKVEWTLDEYAKIYGTKLAANFMVSKKKQKKEKELELHRPVCLRV